MIFRLTAKLARKIKADIKGSHPLLANPFADWTARIFTAERVQYIMVSNTVSLYSVVMYGKGINNGNSFIKETTASLREFLESVGHKDIFEKLIGPSTSIVCFSKAYSQGVTGSMNDLEFQAKFVLNEDKLSPVKMSCILNETPLSYIGYASPERAFPQMKAGPDRGAGNDNGT